jgi:hypothetical protein
MLYEALKVVTLLAAALLVGNEIAVGLFLHPTLRRLPDGVHAATRRAFAEIFGRVMPFWYAGVLILIVVTTWMGPQLRSMAGKLLLASALLWLLAIVYTVIWPAPLNSRIAKWNLGSLPPAWKDDGRRWDGMHAFRLVILLAALVCLTLGIIAAGG